MKLHHNKRTGLLAVLALSLGLAAMPATAGIVSTKHNLGTTGTGSTKLSVGSADLCVYCHTPHGAALAGAGPVPPLWNKVITAGSYTLYDTAVSSTIDGIVVGGTTLGGSASLACLSCHDGTQAMDSMINAPGSGGYNAAGARPTGNTWIGNAGAATGILSNGAGLMNMLGQDLRNDHPINIQYCGGGVTGGGGTTKIGVAANSAACADKDFVGPQAYAGTVPSSLLTGVVGATSVYWMEIGGSVTAGGRDKQDVPLYNAGGAAGPTVECGSCHDPHSSDNVPFLRMSNANSNMCLACHVK